MCILLYLAIKLYKDIIRITKSRVYYNIDILIH